VQVITLSALQYVMFMKCSGIGSAYFSCPACVWLSCRYWGRCADGRAQEF